MTISSTFSEVYRLILLSKKYHVDCQNTMGARGINTKRLFFCLFFIYVFLSRDDDGLPINSDLQRGLDRRLRHTQH